MNTLKHHLAVIYKDKNHISQSNKDYVGAVVQGSFANFNETTDLV